MTEPRTNSFEKALKLHRLMQEILASNSCPNESILAVTTCLNARFIFEAIDGYLDLLEGGKNVAAKLLLRPVIETVLWMAATEDQPDLLYRWICSQEREERKVFLQVVKDPQMRSVIEKQYKQRADDWRVRFESEYPSSTQDNSDLKLLGALDSAGRRKGQKRDGLYHEFYRTYCQHSHGTFMFKAGEWDNIHPIDDDYVAFWSLALALLSLKNHANVKIEDAELDGWITELQKTSRYKF
jgi:hypothetical protein